MNDEWNKIHSYAASIDSYSGAERFSKWIWRYAENFNCPKCKKHLLRYLERVPPSLMHPFVWTWMLHNEVNQRLGKPFFCYSCAYKLYIG